MIRPNVQSKFICSFCDFQTYGREICPLLALVFRKSIFVTSKSVSFLKNVIVCIFGTQVFKWHPFKKMLFWVLTYFHNHYGKVTKFLQHYVSSPSYIHTRILLTQLIFLPYPFSWPYQFCLKYESIMLSLWCNSCDDSYFRHFGAINK